MQILHHFIWKTWAYADLGGPGTTGRYQGKTVFGLGYAIFEMTIRDPSEN